MGINLDIHVITSYLLWFVNYFVKVASQPVTPVTLVATEKSKSISLEKSTILENMENFHSTICLSLNSKCGQHCEEYRQLGAPDSIWSMLFSFVIFQIQCGPKIVQGDNILLEMPRPNSKNVDLIFGKKKYPYLNSIWIRIYNLFFQYCFQLCCPFD